MRGMILLLLLCIASSAQAGTRKLVIDGDVKATYTLPDTVTDADMRTFFVLSEYGDVLKADQWLAGSYPCAPGDAASCSAQAGPKLKAARDLQAKLAGDPTGKDPLMLLLKYFQRRVVQHVAVYEGLSQYATTGKLPAVKNVECGVQEDVKTIYCVDALHPEYPRKLWKAFLKSRGIKEKVEFYGEGE